MKISIAAITSAQLFNVRLTVGYVTAYESAELSRPANPTRINPADYVGKTYGGGSIVDWAEKPRIRAKTLIKEGVPVKDAVERARSNALSDVSLHVYTAARLSMSEAIRQSEAIGYRRVLNSEGCGACLAAADNDILFASDDFATHPNCGCTAEPVYRTDENPLNMTGEERYQMMSPERQAESVGSATAEAINKGDVELTQLQGRSSSDFAPDFLTQRPLEDVI